MLYFARKIPVVFTLLGILLISFLYVSPQNHVAHAMSRQTSSTHYCQCVEYVNSYEGFNPVPYNATDWIKELPIYNPNWGRDSGVHTGDIAVWSASVDPPYGHVAIVSGISGSGQREVVTWLGANQGGSRFNSLECNDASYWSLSRGSWSLAVYFYQGAPYRPIGLQRPK